MGYIVRNFCKECGKSVGEWAILEDCCRHCGYDSTIYYRKETGSWKHTGWKRKWWFFKKKTYTWYRKGEVEPPQHFNCGSTVDERPIVGETRV